MKKKKFFFAASWTLDACLLVTYPQRPNSPFDFSLDPYLFGTCTCELQNCRSVISGIRISEMTYQPLSDSLISLIRIVQVLCSELAIPIRWFLVITWFCMVRIVCVSTRSHATCVRKWTPMGINDGSLISGSLYN